MRGRLKIGPATENLRSKCLTWNRLLMRLNKSTNVESFRGKGRPKKSVKHNMDRQRVIAVVMCNRAVQKRCSYVLRRPQLIGIRVGEEIMLYCADTELEIKSYRSKKFPITLKKLPAQTVIQVSRFDLK